MRNGISTGSEESKMAYDDGNIFARILRGELPCHRVFEDDVALAFMDVMPRVDGHVLVIPKRPARTLFECDPADLAALMPRVQRVGRAACLALASQRLHDLLGLHKISDSAQ